MTALAFDTLKLSRQLVKAGFNEAQADAVLEVAREAHDTADLATKADLIQLGERVDSKLRELELRMTIKLSGIVVIALSILAAISKYL